MIAAASGEDLEGGGVRAVGANGPHDQRLQYTALTDGGKDVGDVGRLFSVAHIGRRDREPVERDECEFHDICSFIRPCPALFAVLRGGFFDGDTRRPRHPPGRFPSLSLPGSGAAGGRGVAAGKAARIS